MSFELSVRQADKNRMKIEWIKYALNFGLLFKSIGFFSLAWRIEWRLIDRDLDPKNQVIL